MSRTTLHPARRALIAAFALAALLAGCSSDGSDAGATSTTSTSAPASVTTAPGSSTAPPGSSVTTSTAPPDGETTVPAAGQACTSGDGTIPDGATSRSIVDVDGDGQADTGWILAAADGSVTVGISTVAGGGDTAAFDSASPVKRAMLVANADDVGPVEIFLDDGRTVQLEAFVGCTIVPVTNPQGDPYLFSLGFSDVGTGVGCVDTDEGRRLVGLDIDEAATDDTTVSWSRTIVELSGTRATNGDTETGTYTRGVDDAAIVLLQDVTCGDLTVTDDGVTAPE